MNKHEMKKERLRIMAEIDRLNLRADAGEDVSKELQVCGHELRNVGTGKPRLDVMDIDTLKNDFRITKEMRIRAQKNGISYSTLQNRIYTLKWDDERALTVVPPKRVSYVEIGLTVDMYKHLRDSGLSDVEIQNKYDIPKHSLSKFKARNGLRKRHVKS